MSEETETRVNDEVLADQEAQQAAGDDRTALEVAEADCSEIGSADSAASQDQGADVAVGMADFAQLRLESELAPVGNGAASLDRLLDVAVTVSVELGSVTVPIGQVLKLGIGSVLELDRSVSDLVDLMAQGILLARGEVVVVDDRFAIRVKEIAEPKQRS